MKLRLVLWILGFLLKRAHKRKPRFRELLERYQRMDWGIATEDLSLARHYRMSPQGIDTAPGLPVDLDLELRFANQQAALTILKKPSQKAFLTGMMNDEVRMVGDSSDLEKLQKLLGEMR